MQLPIPNFLKSQKKPSTADPNIITRESFRKYRGPRPKGTTEIFRVNVGKYEKEVLKGEPLFTREHLELYRDIVEWKLESKDIHHMIYWSALRTSWLCHKGLSYEEAMKVHLRAPLEWAGVHDINKVRPVLQRTVEQWNACSVKADLVDMLLKCAVKMPRVEKIVCIGLGSFARRYGSCYCAQSKVKINIIQQHLLAITIAETLEEYYIQQGTAREDLEQIPIILQDPGYIDMDKTLLTELSPRFSVVEDPEGFLAIDETSFVIHIACSAPVAEVLADLTAAGDCGKGPAGILGDEMVTAKPAQWATGIDFETPRVLEFLKGYEMRDFDDVTISKEDLEGIWDESPWFWWLQLRFRKR
ncbi:hypothetical protein CC80DRAFT_505609 [Byssothecium circinans]|uniref:SRR1-like domain-containing protein n=1 Tax=Byssothecium circinans TaxID=147558 RepID=A0A6A5TUC5_9PLEO|nr:hypothetical protein CC80DRAFT_505609 [Byssothecium circinans]